MGPTSISSWTEYGEICNSIDSYFSSLCNVTVDSASRAANRLPEIKIEMLALQQKVIDIPEIKDDDLTVETLEVLLDDIRNQEQIFLDLKKIGISINVENVG